MSIIYFNYSAQQKGRVRWSIVVAANYTCASRDRKVHVAGNISAVTETTKIIKYIFPVRKLKKLL